MATIYRPIDSGWAVSNILSPVNHQITPPRLGLLWAAMAVSLVLKWEVPKPDVWGDVLKVTSGKLLEVIDQDGVAIGPREVIIMSSCGVNGRPEAITLEERSAGTEEGGLLLNSTDRGLTLFDWHRDVTEQRITDTIIMTTPAPIADMTASGRPPLPRRMSFPLMRYIKHGRARERCANSAGDEFLYPGKETWSGSTNPTDLDSNFVSRQIEVNLGEFSAESRNCRRVGALETEQFCGTVKLSLLVLHTHTSTLLVSVCSWKHDRFARQNSDRHQRLLDIVNPSCDEDAVGFLSCPLPPNLDTPMAVEFKDMVLGNTGDQEKYSKAAQYSHFIGMPSSMISSTGPHRVLQARQTYRRRGQFSNNICSMVSSPSKS
ncbi:hypothetical protein Bbelb_213510 [Branchiostoma belcheri]|nr:hypothetical protein Bbelb_213510 [Branchiostoma belcheri]